MDAEIIAVGSELLTPHRLDTNSLFLTEKLNALGIELRLKTIVGDDRGRLAELLRAALGRSAIIIATGGLGPTEDDLTREVFSEVLGRPLREVEEIRSRIEQRFRQIGRRMAAINLKQAQVPEGAEWLDNPHGTAPGLWIEHNGTQIILLPGPPRELKPMFEAKCAERLARSVPRGRLVTRIYKVAGLSESEVDERIAPLYKQTTNPVTTLLASPGEIEIHLRATAPNEKEAEKLLDELGSRVEKELGGSLFTSCGETLEAVVGKLLRETGTTLAVAEGCTGGRIAERLTRRPGSSQYFLGGVVCYSHESKAQLAGLSPDLIRREGTVSPPVCRALAEGIRRKTQASLGLAVTGLSGPTGATTDKPLGLVYISLAGEQDSEVREFRFTGERERVQELASQTSLHWVRKKLIEQTPGE